MPTANTIPTPTNQRPLLPYLAPTLCPARLDRLADAELQHGHYLAAEMLARRAAELRDQSAC